jgi:RNA polymerase sigma factor (sigma-70 family)
MNSDLTTVWDKFVSGDPSGFRTLFMKYYRGLYGYGVKLSSDPGLVEDCIQELFKSVWERRDDLAHITSPNVYLYVSLRRNILNSKRKMNKYKGLRDSIKEEISISFGIEELIIKNESMKELKEELQKALNQLSNQQKEVIYLHFYNGMSYGEIGEILSINRQSVRNHMYRAMETLRTVLNIDVMRLVISLMIAFLFCM